ncbi:MAG: hypothetical protein HZA15_08125 [Nitrospirae bacterium]|nr:hypothetical protein [Nitrospirota bacterium]
MKVAIEKTKSPRRLLFKVSEDAVKEIQKWLSTVESANYRYQTETGLLGKYYKTKLNEHVLTMIKRHARTSGREEPYKGVSGGAQRYIFSNNESLDSVKIIDVLSRKKLTIKNDYTDNAGNANQPMMVMFAVSGDDMKRFNAWKVSKNLTDDEFGYTFEFTPTGLGMVQIVTHLRSGKNIDLTDYDDW